MLEYRAYRNGEGSRVVSSDIIGQPSDVKRFEKLAKLETCGNIVYQSN